MELATYFSGIASARNPVWVDGLDYSRAVLNQGKALPWSDTAALVAFVQKQQQLLRSDVLMIDLFDFFQVWTQSRPELVQAMAKKSRLNYPLKVLLEDAAAIEQLRDFFKAIASVKSSEPLIIKLASPKLWMAMAFSLAHEGENPDVEWKDAERAALYIAGFLRAFGDTGIDGLLIVDQEGEGPANVDELASYQSLLNVAEHFRWSVGLYNPGVDFSVADNPLSCIVTDRPLETACTGIIPDQFWSSSEPPSLPPADFYYIVVPEQTEPERVLSSLQYTRDNKSQ